MEVSIREEVAKLTTDRWASHRATGLVGINGWTHGCAQILLRSGRRHQKLDQKLVEDDYEALEEDLLEVLGELTTDPEVVLKFLPEVSSIYSLCTSDSHF